MIGKYFIFLWLLSSYCKGCELPNFKADGFCDDGNNNLDCEFDGGDCCGPNVKEDFCSVCECLNGPVEEGNCEQPNFKGDGFCDDGNNNAGCEFDGGDCCGPNVSEDFCSVCECLNGPVEEGGCEL